MSDPQGALSIFAEVAVALAGFSGIVIAFGRRSHTTWDELGRRRLTNLFFLSGLALFVSLLGIALIHWEFGDVSTLWRICSALLVMATAPWLIFDFVRVRRLEAQQRAKVSPYILYTFNLLSIGMLVLQIVNVVLLKEDWPLLLGLVLTVIGAFQQFVLLVHSEIYEAD